ncbi:MAG: ABC transporter substrate-binding protein [Clostridia bacterium]|nr:ABC transporter substrate-binding protein [Clostridia bacterium]
MRKWACLLAAVLLCAMLGGCSSWHLTEQTVTLNVFNWGEYIDDEILDVNALFEEETGIKVNYKTFESNESMYTLLESGAAEYDVVIPSDYMIGKMINEGMLSKLNFDNIPNYKYIDEAYKGLEYDPENEYSVPYTWGTVGIFYNKKYVDEADLAQGWDILWNEKYAGKIYMFDNARDSFAIALKKLGYSMNTSNPAHWQAAYEALAAQKPLVQGYFMDQVFQKMTNEEGWLAPYYSGDGANMITGDDGNENIGFFVPHQGTNLFVDAMCVLATTKHQAEAERYLDFMCRTDVATANAEYICYSTPHTEAFTQLDPEVAEDPMFYPPAEVIENTEVFITLDEASQKLQKNLWIKLKCLRERPSWWPFPS